MVNKAKGPKRLVKRARTKEQEEKQRIQMGISQYSDFMTCKDKFEEYIMLGLSEKHSAVLAGLHPQTIEKQKQKHPEYKERLAMLKSNMPSTIKAKHNLILKTGGDLSPSDYLKALQWYLERNPDTKDEHSKTAHILQETISRNVDDDTMKKIQEVFANEIEEAELIE